MAIEAGTYKLGPRNATLRVKTGRSGAAAKAGHNLEIEVGSWEATLEVGDSSSLELTADATSLSVVRGSVRFDVSVGDDGKLTGGTTVKQSEWASSPTPPCSAR